MKKKGFILFILSFISIYSFSQNLFFIGNRSYPCTEPFRLKTKTSNDLECRIIKNNLTGFIAISFETSLEEIGVIKGNSIIYLDDGTVITLIDRGKMDYVDGISSNIYSLTTSEIEKLKNSNINTIRFSIKVEDGGWSTEEGDYTAKNEVDYYKKERINTTELVKSLFQ